MNEKGEQKEWVVIDFGASSSYHEEDDRWFANEWRSLMMKHDELMHTDLYRVKNRKDKMKSTFDKFEEQNDSDRTSIDVLDLAVTSMALTMSTKRPLEQIEER